LLQSADEEVLMSKRGAALLSLLLLLGLCPRAEAQRQRFKLSGGAGLAVLQNPDVEHGRTAYIGGSLGFRFTDNLSLEGGFSFARSDRQFDVNDVPVDKVQAIPAYRFEATRYHLDGTFLFHIGRRQPFNPYLFAGAGLERSDERRTDLTFTFDENGTIVNAPPTESVVLDTSTYRPAGHFGAGFDLYFLYNLAARVEFRLYVPQDTSLRTRAFFFGASYYF
jgi:Outer membrane protein beta-barrel domain